MQINALNAMVVSIPQEKNVFHAYFHVWNAPHRTHAMNVIMVPTMIIIPMSAYPCLWVLQLSSKPMMDNPQNAQLVV